ncbi:MAG: hypothetical protein Q7J51_01360 [Sheuella sp.]|nr:hypothetical protein [Sheuella sp.]
MKQTLIVVFALLISACATQNTNQVTQVDNFAIKNSNEQIEQIVALQKEECMRPEYVVLRKKSPCASRDITFAELTDATKMTNAQKVLFIKAVAVLDVYSNQITDIYRQLGTPEAIKVVDAREWLQSQNMNNRLELVERKITWGVYLRNRQQMDSEMLRRAKN